MIATAMPSPRTTGLRVVGPRYLLLDEVAEGKRLSSIGAFDDLDAARPRTRGDCLPGGRNEARPCPFIGCRHHLYSHVNPSGSLALQYGEIEDLDETCALDVAARGGITLERVGELLGITRSRVQQIEERLLRKVRAAAVAVGMER